MHRMLENWTRAALIVCAVLFAASAMVTADKPVNCALFAIVAAGFVYAARKVRFK